MKAGKLPESVMKRSVFKQLHNRREDVKVRPAIGLDFSAIDVLEDELVVLSCDPVTEAADFAAGRAVMAALNDVACAGAYPVGVLISLLLPTSANEQQLKDIVKEIDTICEKANAEVLGGHTEVTRAVQRPLITVTGVGKVHRASLKENHLIEPGMDLVATKWIGLEGTAILAMEKEEELLNRFSAPFIDKAKKLIEYMPVWSEAAVAVQSGAGGMHDVSKGGIFGALWEMAQAAGVGLEIELKKIPIRQETVEICEFFDINPYKLISGGCMLIAAKNGEQLQGMLEKQGIPASLIGRTTSGNDRVLLNGEERRFLEHAQTDEIHKVIR